MKFGEFFQAVCKVLASQYNWKEPGTTVVRRCQSLDIIYNQYGLAMEYALRDEFDFKSYAGQTAYKINHEWNNAAAGAISQVIS